MSSNLEDDEKQLADNGGKLILIGKYADSQRGCQMEAH